MRAVVAVVAAVAVATLSPSVAADKLPEALEQLRKMAFADGEGKASATVSPTGEQEERLAAAAAEVSSTKTAREKPAPPPRACRAMPVRDEAFVTLITNNEGYPAGALAISAALEVLGSLLRRIVLVTPNVNEGIRTLLRSARPPTPGSIPCRRAVQHRPSVAQEPRGSR